MQTETTTEEKSEEKKTEEEEKTDENGAEKEEDSNQNANTGLCRYTYIKHHNECLLCKIMTNSSDCFFVNNGLSLLQPAVHFFFKSKKTVFHVYKIIDDVCVHFYAEEATVEKRTSEEDSEEASPTKKVKKDEAPEAEQQQVEAASA